MAYYGYSRYRSGRRSYRRGYRRYRRYGTSVRRYRSVQMNDDETKVMTFTSVTQVTVPVGSPLSLTPARLLNGQVSTDDVTPLSGRLFFAGMMFDRLRFRSVSVTARPRVMPSSSATNYDFYASWNRYGGTADGAVETEYSIKSDPSARQVTWTPGGSGTSLRTWIYATTKDRYQYYPIQHNSSLVSWRISTETVSGNGPAAPFYPNLMLFIDSLTTPETAPSVTLLVRATIEFQGGYSNNTLNYTPPATRAVDDSLSPSKLYELRRGQDVDSLTKRILQFQSENPAEQESLAE